jgi:hydroxymethylglutaryl-CoA lyase
MGTNQIRIHEVGLRDGLQMEARVVPTESKIGWATALAASGVEILQLGSFVHPERVPQMADTDSLVRRFRAGSPTGRPVLSGLVLNQKGLDRALEAGVDLVCMGVSASETHSLKNTRMTVDQALELTLAMGRRALEANRRVQVSIQSAFGCGYEGSVAEERVIRIAERYLSAGLTDISLADTAGHADPRGVRSLFLAIRRLSPEIEPACHFHDTYGLGLANCVAAWEEGVGGFEASFGGLGGCPFTAVAGGNVCTEDLAHLFVRMGLAVGLDLSGLIALSREVSGFFGRDLPGSIYKTGPIPWPPDGSAVGD